MGGPPDVPFGTPPPQNYQRYFVPTIGQPLAEDLLRAADLRPGERVLDVGCGTGVVTRLAAERVGARGSAVGLDVNAGMLAVASAVTPPSMKIEWIEADAQDIPYDDASFDVVLCQMSIQFVPDRLQALREMRRVTAPGGRAVLNVPGPVPPPFDAMADAMGEHIGPEAAGFMRAVFSLHDEGEVTTLLEAAGFREVVAQATSRELRLPAPRDFLWQYIGSTPLAPIVGEAGAEARSALERDVVERWEPFRDGDGMAYHQRVVIGSAKR